MYLLCIRTWQGQMAAGRLKAANHEQLPMSSESSNRKADAEYGIQLTKSAVDLPPVL